jgi:hypothetical protein
VHTNPGQLFLICLALILASGTEAAAHGRRFAYTHQSSVLPAQASEMEFWNTFRFSRDYFYRRLDSRVEFEYGVSGSTMTAFYLNHEMKTFDSGEGSPGGSKATESTVSVSNEWKFKIADPAADPFGFALYTEGTIGLEEAELEGKLIFDKQLGSALLACNLVLEHEWETEINNGTTETARVFMPGIDAGAAWYVTPTLSIGLEGRYLHLLVGGTLAHSALFLGPSIAFSSDKLWLAFTFLPQIANLTGRVSGPIDLVEFERYQARLLFSLEL